jgi:hypothetical protein
MNKNRKLKKTDKKIKKKQIQQRKEKLSKLSTKELMDKREGINPKSESKADYIKRRKGEMNKPSPAKIVPIIAAIGKAALAAGKVVKGVGAAVKGVKAAATASKIGKAVKAVKASKAMKVAKGVKSVIDQTGGTPPAQGGAKSQSLQKFASMDFKSSPNKMVVRLDNLITTKDAPRKKNFDTASAFKMKGFGGFGNESSTKKSPAKAGQTAGQIVRRERLMN